MYYWSLHEILCTEKALHSKVNLSKGMLFADNTNRINLDNLLSLDLKELSDLQVDVGSDFNVKIRTTTLLFFYVSVSLN